MNGKKHTEKAIEKMKIAYAIRLEKNPIEGIREDGKSGHYKIKCTCIDCKISFLKRKNTFNGWSGRCLQCAKKYRKDNAKGRKRAIKEVECKDCKIKWNMRIDQIPKWKGYCKICCQSVKHSTPEQKEKCRINLKTQREQNPEKYLVKPKYGAEH